jgi:predicted DsbA family dithiol-disulfide isomerase
MGNVEADPWKECALTHSPCTQRRDVASKSEERQVELHTSWQPALQKPRKEKAWSTQTKASMVKRWRSTLARDQIHTSLVMRPKSKPLFCELNADQWW